MHHPDFNRVTERKLYAMTYWIKRGEQLPAATLAWEKSEHIKLQVCMNGISREKSTFFSYVL